MRAVFAIITIFLLIGCVSQPIRSWDELCKDQNFVNASVKKKHKIIHKYYHRMYGYSLSKKQKQKIIEEMEIQAGLRKPELISSKPDNK